MSPMFGLFLFAIAVAGVGAMARSRGDSAILWGGVAATGAVLLGYVLMPFAMQAAIVRDNVLPNLAAVLPGAAMWAWIGLTAVFVRFGLGFGRPGPPGMWTCPECKSLNEKSALLCDACREPWKEDRP